MTHPIADDLAKAYDDVAEALVELALVIRRSGTAPVPGQVPAFETPGAPSLAELPLDPWDEPEEAAPPKPVGSAAVCPAHGTEYREGKFGPYCSSLGTDPKWTNDRGYCQLTPKNAAAYLRQKAAR